MMLKHQCVRQLKLGQCNIGCVLMSLNELLFYCGLIISLNLANETHTGNDDLHPVKYKPIS